VGRWRAECPECTESGMGPGAARENPESGRPNAFGTRWGAVAHVWVCVRGWGGAGGWGRAHGGAEVEDGVVGLGPQAEGRQHGRRLLERPHRDAGRGGGEIRTRPNPYNSLCPRAGTRRACVVKACGPRQRCERQWRTGQSGRRWNGTSRILGSPKGDRRRLPSANPRGGRASGASAAGLGGEGGGVANDPHRR